MTTPDTLPDLSGLDSDDWLSALDDLGEREGHFEWLGQSHVDLFIDAGRTLLVSFETMASARARPGARPRGLDLSAKHGWSVLAFLSDGDTWFRDRAVWGTFDRLTDDGFFEDFDRVLFFGAGSCGYAAASLSVAAPGARVLAIRPQATLTPAITGWDKRFPNARRTDFTSRYGYGPDMVEAALRVDIIVDPMVSQDAIHAALYHRPNVHIHRAPYAGPRTEVVLDTLQITDDLILAAMEGTLDGPTFGRLWRARRNSIPYLRMLMRRLESGNRRGLIRHLCAHGLRTPDQNHFARKLNELTEPTAAE